ncbi:hypothetical protein IAR50_000112 [Cryptococcus sp. DSM 104548]
MSLYPSTGTKTANSSFELREKPFGLAASSSPNIPHPATLPDHTVPFKGPKLACLKPKKKDQSKKQEGGDPLPPVSFSALFRYSTPWERIGMAFGILLAICAGAAIERFYDPLKGAVKLDGVDIKSLNLKWLRQQIGSSHLPHTRDKRLTIARASSHKNPPSSNTTVLDNVAYGLIGSKWEHASPEEKSQLIKRACVDANAHDFIMRLPAGTTIIIAHRLSTIGDADEIYVMGEGEVLEERSHVQLLATEGSVYSTLVNNQKLAQETARDASLDEPAKADRKTAAVAPLARAITGRSLARVAMESEQARRKAAAEEDDKLHSSFRLYGRLLKINKAEKMTYIFAVIGSMCAGMVYPALAILFDFTLSNFQITYYGELRHALNRKALWYSIAAIGAFFTWFDEEENSTGAVTSNLADQPQKVHGLFGLPSVRSYSLAQL